jgi:phosphate transport system substrate-binding protein
MLFHQVSRKNHRLVATISILSLAVGLASCGGGETPDAQKTNAPTPGESANPTQASNTSAGGATITLTGAGASFPAPLYTNWFTDLNKKNPNLQVNYQSVGSGAGVKQFTEGTVDFGASDVAMKDEEIKKIPADKGVLLLPLTAGSIVLAYNLPDVPELKLTRKVYVDILLGKIKSWDDPAIAQANPGAKLSKQPITVVYRSDGSGTTAVFTKHLSAISPEWKTKVGDGKNVKWPVGVGAKGNEGVSAQILQTQGAIGYVEFGYAKNNNLKFAALENKAGKIIPASLVSAAKTLEAVTLPDNLRAFIPDPEGPDSYPIVTYTWLLAYKKYSDPAKAKAMVQTIEYALTDGQKTSSDLGYIPLPAKVIARVAKAANQIDPGYPIKAGSGAGAAK